VTGVGDSGIEAFTPQITDGTGLHRFGQHLTDLDRTRSATSSLRPTDTGLYTRPTLMSQISDTALDNAITVDTLASELRSRFSEKNIASVGRFEVEPRMRCWSFTPTTPRGPQ
jgi:hypothetical protein